jgi:hypothetical protein
MIAGRTREIHSWAAHEDQNRFPAEVSRVFAEKRKQQPIFGCGNCCCSCVWFAAYLGTVFAVQKKQEQAMHKKTPKKSSCQIRAVSDEYSPLLSKTKSS